MLVASVAQQTADSKTRLLMRCTMACCTLTCNIHAGKKSYAFWSRQDAHLPHGHCPVVSTSVWRLLLFAVRLYERLQAADAVAAAVTAEPAPWTQSWHLEQILGRYGGLMRWQTNACCIIASGMPQLAKRCYDNRSSLVTAAVPCSRANAHNPLHELHEFLTADC